MKNNISKIDIPQFIKALNWAIDRICFLDSKPIEREEKIHLADLQQLKRLLKKDLKEN